MTGPSVTLPAETTLWCVPANDPSELASSVMTKGPAARISLSIWAKVVLGATVASNLRVTGRSPGTLSVTEARKPCQLPAETPLAAAELPAF